MGAGVTEEQFAGMSALVEGDLANAVGSESYRRRWTPSPPPSLTLLLPLVDTLPLSYHP